MPHWRILLPRTGFWHQRVPAPPTPRTAAHRSVLFFLLISTGALALLWLLAQLLVLTILERQTSTQLEFESVALAESYRRDGLPGLVSEVAAHAARARLVGDAVVLLTDPSGRVLAGNLLFWPPSLQAAYPGEYEVALISPTTPTANGNNANVSFAMLYHRFAGGYRLLIGQSLEAQKRVRRLLGGAFALVFLPTAGIIALAGWRTSHTLLGRINRISTTSLQVFEGAIGARVPRDHSGDEFDMLADVLNRMLERNEELVGALRATTMAVAHDLRTPLTRLRGRLEKAQELHESERDGDADATELREQLEGAIQEIESVRRMFDALVAIAHAEAGLGERTLERIDCTALVRDVHDLYAPIAEEQGYSLVLRSTAAVVPLLGNRQLLFQAVVNLVENALHYAARETGPPLRIAVALMRSAEGGVRIAVVDNGTGLPTGVRARILARTDGSARVRTNLSPAGVSSGGGHGLGLALVAAVAHLHGGTLVLENRTAADTTASLGEDLTGDEATSGLAASLAFPPEARARNA